MKRVIGVLLVAVVAAGAGTATGPASGPATKPAGPRVSRLTVRPQATTRPDLWHHLLPAADERVAGNAVVGYLRTLEMSHAPPPSMLAIDPAMQIPDDIRKSMGDKWDLYELLPLKELPTKDVEQLLSFYAGGFEEVERAGKKSNTDWGLDIQEKGFGTLLPHLNTMHELAVALRVRTRLQIARGDYAAAIGSIRNGLAMAHALNQEDLGAQSMLAIGIAYRFVEELKELQQQPGAPNLYWALANLPHPFISLRDSIGMERLMMRSSFPQLYRIRSGSYSEEDTKSVQEKLGLVLSETGGFGRDKGTDWLDIEKAYPEAKEYLSARGKSAKQIESMRHVQVVATYWLDSYEEQSDGFIKWTGLPYWQGYAGMEASSKEMGEVRDKSRNPLLWTMWAVNGAYRRCANLDRAIVGVQTIEALRDYAGRHDGALPAALSDITQTPLPIDPWSGKWFEYHRDGQHVVLTSQLGEGMEASDNVRYEVTFEK